MRHVALNEVTGREGAAEGELTGEDTGGDDTGELARVVTGVGWVGAAHTEEVEHCGLGLEDGPTAEGADFDRGHGDGDLEVTVEAGAWLARV